MAAVTTDVPRDHSAMKVDGNEDNERQQEAEIGKPAVEK